MDGDKTFIDINWGLKGGYFDGILRRRMEVILWE